MELKTLKSFVAVATLKSFSAAAKELYTVQPAISRHISTLEEELGVKLFFRNSREVSITTAGERLLNEAVELLQRVELAKEQVVKTYQGEIGSLTIAYMGGATLSFIPGLVRHYSSLYPNVDINLIEMTASEQIEAFQQNKIDLGFSRPMPKLITNEYQATEIYIDTLTAILPDHHPLADETTIELSELQDETFVLFARSEAVGIFDAIISLCQQAKFSPFIKNQPKQMQTLLTQVAAGIGVSIAPSSIRKLTCAGCRFVAIRGVSADIPLLLHHQKNRLSPSAEAFTKIVIETIPAIQESMTKR
ncbi:MAG: LysR substrate-binding domain-containing protein [Psychromonas sp.]